MTIHNPYLSNVLHVFWESVQSFYTLGKIACPTFTINYYSEIDRPTHKGERSLENRTHCGALSCKWVHIKTNKQDIYVFTAQIDTRAANKCYKFSKVRIKQNKCAWYPTFTTWSSIISGPTKVRTVPKNTVRTPTTIKPTATLDLFIAIVSYWQTVLYVPVLLVSTDRQKNTTESLLVVTMTSPH